MKNQFLGVLLLLAVSVTFQSQTAQAHGGTESRVSMEAEQQGNLIAGDKIGFGFQLYDEVTKTAIGDQNLQESHTKKLHLIVYDASLKEFNHVHPEFDGKIWSADLKLKVNGSYYIWAQGTLNDGTEFSAVYQTNVEGGSSPWPVAPLGDFRKSTDNHTVVELSSGPVHAGQMTMLNFTVSRDDGLQPEVTPYLGAMAHVIAVSPDGDELIHVHPMAGGSSSAGMIHATFAVEGDYRIWVQLNDHNELKTIPLSVTVLK